MGMFDSTVFLLIMNHSHRLISLLTCDGEDSRRQMQLTLVFEFIEQDLYQFLQHYPKPKLPINEVKVCKLKIETYIGDNINYVVLWWKGF